MVGEMVILGPQDDFAYGHLVPHKEMAPPTAFVQASETAPLMSSNMEEASTARAERGESDEMVGEMVILGPQDDFAYSHLVPHKEMAPRPAFVQASETAPLMPSNMEAASTARAERGEFDEMMVGEMDETSNKHVERGDCDKATESCILRPGDLAWAKVGKWPYWPTLVSYHPSTGMVCKTIKRSNKMLFNSYHVQYFGQVSHGWTPVGNNCLPFLGREEYIDSLNKLKKIISEKEFSVEMDTKEVHKLKKKIASLEISVKHKDKWESAVKEAEGALLISDREERYFNYVFAYETKPGKASKEIPQSNGDVTSNILQKEKDQQYQKLLTNYCRENDLKLMKLIPRVVLNREDISARKVAKSNEGSSPIKSPIICKACCNPCTEIFCCRSCGCAFHLECIGLQKKIENFHCVACWPASRSSIASDIKLLPQ